jgi:hypothetical protein
MLAAACSGSPAAPSTPTLVAGTTTIGFNDAGEQLANVDVHRESGYVVLPSSGQWVVLKTYGRPAPFIQFTRTGSTNTVGEVQVFAEGAAFRFSAVDLYSSVTPIPYVFEGYLRETLVFTAAGTVPNTFGNFATVRNPNAADVITTLVIRLTNPAIGCVGATCSNPVGLDNIVVGF